MKCVRKFATKYELCIVNLEKLPMKTLRLKKKSSRYQILNTNAVAIFVGEHGPFLLTRFAWDYVMDH